MNLHELLEKTVAGLGFELVDVELSPRGRTIRVFIDQASKEGGIDVDDCARVSHQLSRLFEVENVDYDRLEVSSPGLDRPLVKPEDYRRFSGREVQLKLRVPLGNQRNFSGVLEGLKEEGGVELVCLKVNETLHRFAFENIDRARLVPKF